MKDSTTTTTTTTTTTETETTDEDIARARFGVDRSPRARATTRIGVLAECPNA